MSLLIPVGGIKLARESEAMVSSARYAAIYIVYRSAKAERSMHIADLAFEVDFMNRSALAERKLKCTDPTKNSQQDIMVWQ